jgi:prepilin-type processing-associated H-X9-DG protein
VATTDYAGNGGPFTFWMNNAAATELPFGGTTYVNYRDPGNGNTFHFGTIIKPFTRSGPNPPPNQAIINPLPAHWLIAEPIKMSDIDDGASNTILVAEKRWNNAVEGQPQLGDWVGYTAGYGLDTIRTASSAQPLGPGNNTAAQAGDPVLPRVDDSFGSPPSHPDGFGSAHRSGFNALFVDGSVRHLRYDMTLAPQYTLKYNQGNSTGITFFQRLCDRNDGGTVDPRSLE